MPTYRTSYVIGRRPAHLPTGIAMVAPRPLYGQPVEIDPDWGWVGQVVVDPMNGSHLARNADLDAAVVVWVAKEDAVAAEVRRLNGEYPDQAEAINQLDEDELLRSYLTRHGAVTKEVPLP